MDGHTILGRTVASATAALGPPDFRSGQRRTYMLGWGPQPNFSIEVRFRPVAGVERAWSIAFERDVRDVKLGALFGHSSPELQAATIKRYANRFRLVRPYWWKRSVCSGELIARSGPLRVTFATGPTLGSWPAVYV